jgi:hypothetical protein
MSTVSLWLFGAGIVALTVERGLIALALWASAVWCLLA